MISKKLLSEVLPNTERYTYKFIDGEPIQVDHKWQGIIGTLNLYELAHLCKEWAVNGGLYKLESATFKNSDTGKIEGTASVGKYHFPQESEPQAIFKACEWIMDQE